MTTSPAESSLRKDADSRPFGRVLIANRGEIAIRIIRACRDLGIESVAVYSDADREALHVRMADAAIHIGAAPAAESYLVANRIVAAAVASGADAVHPGYGFLSERASFAEAVTKAGLAFVGPDAAAIAALGDKVAARRTAKAAAVPVVPGTDEPVPVDRPSDLAAVINMAAAIGYPLMVKAAAGGGGRGMRRVAVAAELPAALAAGSAEALAAFGDGALYLEREIRPARHIEVQLLGDMQGTVVALGERDCSLQRRHQKLVEEAPAPGLSDDEREQLHDMAIRAVAAAGLYNAATAEFLFDEGRRFWFLEVNARLQVEHGVTELVTGVDLVVEQLRIAAGRPLSDLVMQAAQAARRPTRAAIEVRVSAEDPARDFAPTPGVIGRWVMPSGPSVRVDAGVRAGDRVAPDYDPMIAKIMTVGPDRSTAIDRMRRALAETEISGIQTTLPFHRAVMVEPSFAQGDLGTDWVAQHWNGPGQRAARLERAREAAAAAAEGDAGGRNMTDAHDPAHPAPASLRKDVEPSGWGLAGRRAQLDRWPR